jgi:hypothetical protein
MVFDKVSKDTEEETRLWVSAYHDAEKLLPNQDSAVLKEAADKLLLEVRKRKP